MFFKSNFAKAILLTFNRLHAIWPNGYQRGSLGKRRQNGEYLNQATRKRFPTTVFL